MMRMKKNTKNSQKLFKWLQNAVCARSYNTKIGRSRTTGKKAATTGEIVGFFHIAFSQFEMENKTEKEQMGKNQLANGTILHRPNSVCVCAR